MKRLLPLAFALLAIALVHAAPSDIVGTWVGRVQSEHGEMPIKLEIVNEKGKLSGKLGTAHGDWEVTGIEEKDGAWIVSFKHEGGGGRLSGMIKDGRFAGDWSNGPQGVGTFELVHPKKGK